MTKTITISARVSQEDAQFISQLAIDNAKTPSDKLRALITEARLRHENRQDFRGCLTMIQDMIRPVSTQVRETEIAAQQHSEIVSRTLEWLPEMVAFILAVEAMEQETMDRDQLHQIENGIADRVFRLMESTLQLAITQRSSCYDAAAIEQRIPPILDLLEAIRIKK